MNFYLALALLALLVIWIIPFLVAGMIKNIVQQKLVIHYCIALSISGTIIWYWLLIILTS